MNNLAMHLSLNFRQIVREVLGRVSYWPDLAGSFFGRKPFDFKQSPQYRPRRRDAKHSARKGRNQHEIVDYRRMPNRQFLRDSSAHRIPEYMRWTPAYLSEQPHNVLCHIVKIIAVCGFTPTARP